MVMMVDFLSKLNNVQLSAIKAHASAMVVIQTFKILLKLSYHVSLTNVECRKSALTKYTSRVTKC